MTIDELPKIELYVDWENGDDVFGDGSKEKPFLTYPKAMSRIPRLYQSCDVRIAGPGGWRKRLRYWWMRLRGKTSKVPGQYSIGFPT